jgi:N-hydroxyarylamine O-acetyltransferase
VDLSAYLARIGFDGDPAPRPETLAEVQRRHLMAIPYENLDVMLGRTTTTDPAEAFDKMVARRRGGWCYEMNGVMGWALAEMGFTVTRLASGVFRSQSGDDAIGNHLVLRVDFEEGPILADAGLAGGAITPYPVREGQFQARGLEYRLEAVADDWWRFHNSPQGMAPNFDFKLDRTDEAALSRTCVKLQTEPDSMFVQNLVCHRFTPDGEVQLRGRVLRRITRRGTEEQLLESADHLTGVLGDEFGIDEPAAAGLWPKVCARHDVLFPVNG